MVSGAHFLLAALITRSLDRMSSLLFLLLATLRLLKLGRLETARGVVEAGNEGIAFP